MAIIRSQEWTLKQRQAKLGKLNNALIGRKYSKEHRKAISDSLKGRHLSESHRRAISEGNNGKKTSPETIEKRRLKVMGQKRSLKSKARMSKAHRGQISYWKGKHLPEETKKKLRQKRLNQIFPKQDTSIEVKMQNELKNRAIDFKTHYPLLGQPDIFIKPNICVFCDGDYWHNYPNGRETDKRITKQLLKEGYEVFRFWENDINNDVKECVNGIGVV